MRLAAPAAPDVCGDGSASKAPLANNALTRTGGVPQHDP